MNNLVNLLFYLLTLVGSIPGTNAWGGDIHAVLIAGSNSYYNYRHQADVAHAFHVLKNHGVKTKNIITMMYNDVVDSDENPFPGKLYNQPNGINLAEGLIVDYQGNDVNPENFQAVLKGEAHKVKGGNGRVLKSTHKDKVFIYFSDHGGVGTILIVNELLTVKQLNETLREMQSKRMFKELVFYMEACESGSMFENILPSDTHILGITASNSSESSWGTYCDDPVLNTCLGDEFSVNWMENTERTNIRKETIEQQYEKVKQKTIKSNVMKYGDLSITSELASHFQGAKSIPITVFNKTSNTESNAQTVRWPSRDIPLLTLESQMRRTTDQVERQKLAAKLNSMKTKRAYHDMHTRDLVHSILAYQPIEFRELMLHSRHGSVDDMDCHHDVLHAYNSYCFNMGINPYAMRVSGILNNLCTQGLKIDTLVSAIRKYCSQNYPLMGNIH